MQVEDDLHSTVPHTAWEMMLENPEGFSMVNHTIGKRSDLGGVGCAVDGLLEEHVCDYSHED